MAQYISKAVVVAEIERRIKLVSDPILSGDDLMIGERNALFNLLSFLDILEVKEVDLIDKKTDWSPSKKQMESLKDMLKYNIGVFDYQKFMEVNSLYDDLTKIVDYGIDRQK